MPNSGKGLKIVALVLGVFAYAYIGIAAYAKMELGSELWILPAIIGLVLGTIGLMLSVAGQTKHKNGLGVLALIIDIWMIVGSITLIVLFSIPGLEI